MSEMTILGAERESVYEKRITRPEKTISRYEKESAKHEKEFAMLGQELAELEAKHVQRMTALRAELEVGKESHRAGNESNDITINGLDKMPKHTQHCLLHTSPSPRDRQKSRMPSSA